jgi:hypothetical protein
MGGRLRALQHDGAMRGATARGLLPRGATLSFFVLIPSFLCFSGPL